MNTAQIQSPLKKKALISNKEKIRQSVISGKSSKTDISDSKTPENMPPPTEDEPKHPKKIGNYVIEKHIGTGGMGKIYKAFNPNINRAVAIKILLAGDMADPRHKERFLREAKLSAKLNHPNIIHVYDVGVDQGLYYIVMDYIDGKTLEALIKQKEIKRRWVIQHMASIAEALYYAHQNGVIHRDIKPSNIMITSDDIPIVMDFGLARGIEDKEGKMTRTGQLLGTPQYMSPEQAKGARVDARSDIYSFGAMFYETLCGRPVVTGVNLMVVLHFVINQEPVPLSHHIPSVSRDIEAICMKCLEKDPNRRYQDMSQLADDLRKFLAGENISARPLTWHNRLWRKLKKHTYAIFTLVFILSFLTLFFLVFGFFVKKKEIDHSLADGIKALDQGYYILAWDKFNDVLQKDANNEDAHKKLDNIEDRLLSKGQKLFDAGDYANARKTYQMILEINMASTKASKAIQDIQNHLSNMMGKADEKGSEGREEEWKEAKNTYECIIKGDPENIEAKERYKKLLRTWALTYYQKAMEINNPQLKRIDLQRCITLLSNAIERDGEFTEAYFERGRIYHRMSHTEEAIEDYKKCMELNPKLLPPKYYMAKIQFNEIIESHKDFPHYKIVIDPALQIYERLLSAYSLYSIEHQNLLMWRTGEIIVENYYKALEVCKEIEEKNPFFSEVHFLKANIYEDISWIFFKSKENESAKALDQALSSVNRGLELNPYNGEGYFQRGNIYLSVHEFPLALQDYEKALKLGFCDCLLHYNAALCFFALKDYKEAERYILIALSGLNLKKEVFPSYIWGSHYILSCCYFFQGKYQKAIEEMDNSVKPGTIGEQFMLTPEVPIYINFIKALYLCFLNRYDEAQRILEECNKNRSSIPWLAQLEKYKKIINIDDMLTSFLDPFQADPGIKNKTKALFTLLYTEMSNIEELKKYSTYLHVNFTIIMQAIIEKLNKSPEQASRLENISKKINSVYSVKTIFYCMLYVLDSFRERRILKLTCPLSYKLYYRRACIYYNYKEFDKSLKDLERALDQESSDMKIHYAMAVVLSLESEKDPSYKQLSLYHLQRAIELGWEHRDYTKNDPDFMAISKTPEFLNIINTPPQKTLTNLFEELKKKSDALLDQGNVKTALQLLKPYKGFTDENISSLIIKIENDFTDILRRKIKDIIDKQEQTQTQAIKDILDEAETLLSQNSQKKLRRAIAEYLTKQGDLLEQKKQYEDARDKYDLALEYDAQCWIAYAKKGDLIYNNSDFLGVKTSEASLNWKEALLFCPELDAAAKIQQKIDGIR